MRHLSFSWYIRRALGTTAAGVAANDGRDAVRRAVLVETEAATEDAAAIERVRVVRAANILCGFSGCDLMAYRHLGEV